MSPATVSTFLDSLRAMLVELEALRLPTIAVVDGFALGGGAELSLACDLRVGGELSPMLITEHGRERHKVCSTRDEIGYHPWRRRDAAPYPSGWQGKGEGADLYWSTARRGRGGASR